MAIWILGDERLIGYFLLNDQKKVTKEKSPAVENFLKLSSPYRKITRHAFIHTVGAICVTQTNFPVFILRS